MSCGRRVLRVLAAVAGASLVASLSAGGLQAAETFTISPMAQILNPGAVQATAIHEMLIAEAVGKIAPKVSPAAIGLMQAGAEDVDFIHQWDAEFHFDNASIANGDVFLSAFTNMQKELAVAVQIAEAAPYPGTHPIGTSSILYTQFVAPKYPSFFAMFNDVEVTLKAVLTKCPSVKGCPIARINYYLKQITQAKIDLNSAFPTFKGHFSGLQSFPNPDTDGPTDPQSLFAAKGKLGGLTKAWLHEFKLLEQLFTELVPQAGGGLPNKLGPTDPLVRSLINQRDFLQVYPAFLALGHGFHAAQDFFAHTNYVELMAGPQAGAKYANGVQVGMSIAKLGVNPSQIPLPKTFDDFTLPGLRKLMGRTLYNQLASGWASTPWLGEGDYCASKYSNLNPLTAGQGDTGDLESLTGLTINPGKTPGPPQGSQGFQYCHYNTATNIGLNKDEPYSLSDEPSHQNYDFARFAASRVSQLLFSWVWDQLRACLIHTPRATQAGGSTLAVSCQQPSNTLFAGAWSTFGGTGALGLEAVSAAKGERAVEFYSGGSANCGSGSVYYTGYYSGSAGSGQVAGCSTGRHLMGWYKSGAGEQHGTLSIDLGADDKTFSGTYDELSSVGTGSGPYNGSLK